MEAEQKERRKLLAAHIFGRLDPLKKYYTRLMYKYFYMWGKIHPLTRMKNDLESQMRERVGVLSTFRASYYRDILSVKDVCNQILIHLDIPIDIGHVPSADLRNVIDDLISNNPSEMLREVFGSLRKLDKKGSIASLPWERSQSFQFVSRICNENSDDSKLWDEEQKRSEEEYEEEFPSVFALPMFAPSSATLLASLCPHCVGIFQLTKSWESHIEKGFMAVRECHKFREAERAKGEEVRLLLEKIRELKEDHKTQTRDLEKSCYQNLEGSRQWIKNHFDLPEQLQERLRVETGVLKRRLDECEERCQMGVEDYESFMREVIASVYEEGEGEENSEISPEFEGFDEENDQEDEFLFSEGNHSYFQEDNLKSPSIQYENSINEPVMTTNQSSEPVLEMKKEEEEHEGINLVSDHKISQISTKKCPEISTCSIISPSLAPSQSPIRKKQMRMLKKAFKYSSRFLNKYKFKESTVVPAEELEGLRRLVEELGIEVRKNHSLIQNYAHQLSTQTKNMIDMRKRNSELEKQLKDMKLENNKLKSDIISKEEEHNQELLRMREEMREVCIENEELSDEVERKEDEVSDLKIKVRKVTRKLTKVEGELEEMKRLENEGRAGLVEKEVQCEILGNDGPPINHEEIEQLRRDLKEEREKCDVFQVKNEELELMRQEKNLRIDQLELDKEKLKEKYQKLQCEFDEFRQDLENTSNLQIMNEMKRRDEVIGWLDLQNLHSSYIFHHMINTLLPSLMTNVKIENAQLERNRIHLKGRINRFCRPLEKWKSDVKEWNKNQKKGITSSPQPISFVLESTLKQIRIEDDIDLESRSKRLMNFMTLNKGEIFFNKIKVLQLMLKSNKPIIQNPPTSIKSLLIKTKSLEDNRKIIQPFLTFQMSHQEGNFHWMERGVRRTIKSIGDGSRSWNCFLCEIELFTQLMMETFEKMGEENQELRRNLGNLQREFELKSVSWDEEKFQLNSQLDQKLKMISDLKGGCGFLKGKAVKMKEENKSQRIGMNEMKTEFGMYTQYLDQLVGKMGGVIGDKNCEISNLKSLISIATDQMGQLETKIELLEEELRALSLVDCEKTEENEVLKMAVRDSYRAHVEYLKKKKMEELANRIVITTQSRGDQVDCAPCEMRGLVHKKRGKHLSHLAHTPFCPQEEEEDDNDEDEETSFDTEEEERRKKYDKIEFSIPFASTLYQTKIQVESNNLERWRRRKKVKGEGLEIERGGRESLRERLFRITSSAKLLNQESTFETHSHLIQSTSLASLNPQKKEYNTKK